MQSNLTESFLITERGFINGLTVMDREDAVSLAFVAGSALLAGSVIHKMWHKRNGTNGKSRNATKAVMVGLTFVMIYNFFLLKKSRSTNAALALGTTLVGIAYLDEFSQILRKWK